MNQERALKVVLGLVGLIFVASIYPLVVFVRAAPALSMMFSHYVTLGVFLLLAIRNQRRAATSSRLPRGQASLTRGSWDSKRFAA
jgi:hypothetical protein